jgi:hypothetical protein
VLVDHGAIEANSVRQNHMVLTMAKGLCVPKIGSREWVILCKLPHFCRHMFSEIHDSNTE